MATTLDRRETLSRRGIQPGTLPLADSAAFVGVSPNTFRKEVAAGRLPPPLPLASRRRLWSIAQLRLATGEGAPPVSGPDYSDEIDKAIDEYAV